MKSGSKNILINLLSTYRKKKKKGNRLEWANIKYPRWRHLPNFPEMGGGQVSLQNFLSIPTVGCGFRPKKSGRKTGPEPRLLRSRTKVRKCVVRSRLADRSPPKSTVDVDRLVDFLYEDLRHVFDAQGIDPTAYDEHVRFRDPITKYNGIRGYMLNIALLRQLFRPQFLLHWVKKVRSINFCYDLCFLFTFHVSASVLDPWKLIISHWWFMIPFSFDVLLDEFDSWFRWDFPNPWSIRSSKVNFVKYSRLSWTAWRISV